MKTSLAPETNDHLEQGRSSAAEIPSCTIAENAAQRARQWPDIAFENTAVLDEYRAALAGEAPADWQQRQQKLRSLLRAGPVRTTEPGERAGSAAVLADREETER